MKSALTTLLLAMLAGTVQAATLVVDSTFDDPDQAPGDGACDSTRGTTCTLRAAIQEANALPGADAIEFAIGASTLVPLTPYPVIRDDLVIDGTTSPDWSPAGEGALDAPPAIYLDGFFLSGSTDDGLSASGTSSDPVRVEIRGLGIVRFPRYGIDVTFGENAWIEANWIGVERTAASTTVGNGSHGVLLSACSGCTVGSALLVLFEVPVRLGRGNAIANNGGDGILSGLGSGTLLGGNQIGMLPSDPEGTYHSGRNAGRGISLLDADATVGQLSGSVNNGNWISFNGSDGIYSGATSVRIEANRSWLNGGAGIVVLGDDATLQFNDVRHNTGHGVHIGSATGAADGAVVASNGSSSNEGRGIYLENGSAGLIEGNSIYLNDNDGVRIDGNSNVLRRNRIGVMGTSTLAGNRFNGVVLAGDDNDVTDNEILDTAGDGIDVSGQRSTIRDNLVGVTRQGEPGGNSVGIRVRPTALVTDLLGNTVVASNGNGMLLEADGVLACGNHVGLLQDGRALANAGSGIRLLGDGAFIGRYPPAPSACAGGGNRISNNYFDGIEVQGSGNLIAENLLQAQGRGGVFLAGAAQGNQVLDNLLAANAGAAVRVGAATGTGNRIERNFFPLVFGLPVDLADDGPTLNDPGDADTGPNELMNHPQIVAVSARGGAADVTYRIDISGANATFPLKVDFYLVVGDGAANAYEMLGSDSFDAPPLTQQTASVLLPEGVEGGAIAAMVTDGAGSSSEIGPGAAFGVPAAGTPLFADGFED